MRLLTILKNLFSRSRTWPVVITVDGELITATADKENEYGKWHITYEVPHLTYPVSKWITPTPAQRQERFETKKR